jgi:hypothetical protein
VFYLYFLGVLTMSDVNEVWSDDMVELAVALESPANRVFRNRSGVIVDDVRSKTPDDHGYIAWSDIEGWYYLRNGQLYRGYQSQDDIVAFRVIVEDVSGKPVVIETTDNPDFLRLLSYATSEAATETIRKEFPGYRLLETLHLKMLGHTGKRKPCTWESGATLRALLDVDRMCDSVPWTISEGNDIHSVFRNHRPNSCMKDASKQELVNLYAINPEQVKTAHLTKSQNGLLQSDISCLVWYGNDTVYIDRRYSEGYLPNTKDSLIRSLVRQLTSTTGKQVKQVWKGDNISGLENIDKPVQFCLNRDSDYMPWCDSVRYVAGYDDDTVTLSTSDKVSRICCQDQSGTDITRSGSKCCECGCRWNEDSDRSNDSGDLYCESCWSDNYSQCEWSEEDYPAEDVQTVRVYCYESRYRQRRPIPGTSPEWCTMDISDDTLSDSFTELRDGRYCHNDLVIEDNRGDYHSPDSDDFVTTEDGEVYNPNDAVQLRNGETHPADECVEVDGEWYIIGTEPSVENVETEVK